MGTAEIGVYGLGTMGSALALNMADHGINVAVTNLQPARVDTFMKNAGALAANIAPRHDLAGFVAALAIPRTVLFMIPSGAPLDAMIGEIRPLLAPGDTVIDAGNADFNDTRRRGADLARQGIHFVGMGVSGGAEGARHGPSMMVGGPVASWQRFQPIAEAIAARFQGDPCVAHVGPDGAGHFVKTVHNGIEYADMQMIAEIYGTLRDGAGWDAARIGALFSRWNDGALASYLTEITGRVLGFADPDTGMPLVDLIVDRAGQKGTGRWTVIEALKLGQSASAIEAAVGARGWSSEKETREVADTLLASGTGKAALPDEESLAAALLAGRILALAQGFRVLAAASEDYGWSLDLARIAEIWRAGCIIRSGLLDDLATALRGDMPQAQLILSPGLRDRLGAAIPGLRRVVAHGVQTGLPVPAFAAALGWYDSMRHGRGTANLIQAQRDFFGAHGFRRSDRDGVQHADWSRT